MMALSALKDRICPDQTGRWGNWLPVMLAVGVLIYFNLTAEPDRAMITQAMTAAGLGAVAALVLRLAGWGRSSLLCGALAAVALGFVVAQHRAQSVAAPVLYAATAPLWISGVIDDIDVPTTRGLRLTLADVTIDDWPRAITPVRVRVSLKPGARAEAGQRVRLRAILMPPPGAQLDGTYDFARTAWFRQIGATGFALTAPEVSPIATSGVAAKIHALRSTIAARLRAHADDQRGHIMAALTVGFTDGIAADETEAWRASGLVHIISISGLHMAIVCGGVFFAMRLLLAGIPPLALRVDIKKLAAVAGLVSGYVYLLLSGGDPPAERAYIMAAVAFVAILFGRRAISGRALAVAGTIIILRAPEVVVGASFQMSYMATMALVAMYEGLTARPRSPVQHWAWRLLYLGLAVIVVDVLTSVTAGLATAPFAAYHFNRATAYGLLANILAAPVTTFWVMPGLSLGLLLTPMGLEGPVLAFTAQGVGVLSHIAHGVAALPRASFWVPSAPSWAMLVLALAMCWICVWRGGVRWLAVPVVVMLGIAVWRAPRDLAWVSADGQSLLVAASDAGQPAYGQVGKRVRYTAEAWLRKVGSPEGELRPLPCDSLGCAAPPGAAVAISLTRDAAALAEDCRANTVVIYAGPLSATQRAACRALLIDDWTVARMGGVRVYRKADGTLALRPGLRTDVARLWTAP